jgi:hypothetical protein
MLLCLHHQMDQSSHSWANIANILLSELLDCVRQHEFFSSYSSHQEVHKGTRRSFQSHFLLVWGILVCNKSICEYARAHFFPQYALSRRQLVLGLGHCHLNQYHGFISAARFLWATGIVHMRGHEVTQWHLSLLDKLHFLLVFLSLRSSWSNPLEFYFPQVPIP